MKRKIVVLAASLSALGALNACQTRRAERRAERREAGAVDGPSDQVRPRTAVSPEESIKEARVRSGPQPMVHPNTAVSPEETVAIVEDEIVVVASEVEAAKPAKKAAQKTVVTPTKRPAKAQAVVGRATECGVVVESHSAGAVGNPCLTSSQFMQTLGLTDEAIARVEKASKLPQVAH